MSAPAANQAPASERALLWLVATGLFMQTLDATIVNTALPAMARSLHESPLRMQAMVIAYALTMAVVIPASGWLAERFGTQRVFLLAMTLFAASSAACAASTTLTQLTAARVLQGLGGAMLMPVGRLTLLRTVPRHRFLDAMGFIAIAGMLGPLLGRPWAAGWRNRHPGAGFFSSTCPWACWAQWPRCG